MIVDPPTKTQPAGVVRPRESRADHYINARNLAALEDTGKLKSVQA